METVLSITNTPYERVPELIVGSYIEYEYRGLSPVNLFEDLSNKLNEISDFVENKFLEHNINTLQQLFDKEPLTVKNIEEKINNVVFDNIDKIISYELYLSSDCEEVSDIMVDILNNECASDRYISKYNQLESDKILDFLDNIKLPEKNIQKRNAYK